jgi:hypothetical protein
MSYFSDRIDARRDRIRRAYLYRFDLCYYKGSQFYREATFDTRCNSFDQKMFGETLKIGCRWGMFGRKKAIFVVRVAVKSLKGAIIKT